MLLADHIISVQPMTGPVGLIFTTKFRYSPSNAETLFKDREVIVTDMNIVHTSKRPYMAPGNPEPNEHYRLWLEQNVGAQGFKWNWHLSGLDAYMLNIEFSNTADATLFELKWP